MISLFLEKKFIILIDLFLRKGDDPADKIFQNFCQKEKLNSHNRRFLSEIFFDFLRHYWLYIYQITPDFSESSLSAISFEKFYNIWKKNRKTEENIHESLKNAPLWVQANMHPQVWNLFQNSFFNETIAIQEARCLQGKAPCDLRINTFAGFTKSTIIQQLCSQNIIVDELPKDGIRLYKRYPLHHNALYQSGAFEIQEFGSQMVSKLCNAQPNMNILDYCAGGGGKTLALLNDMQGKGTLTLTDIDSYRLAKAQKRFLRIKKFPSEIVRFIEIEKISGVFDLVLVDAPCSGIGTLRRNPDKTVSLRSSIIESFSNLQVEILQKASVFVKQGKYIVYITCSLLKAENEDVVQSFLVSTPSFQCINMNELWRAKFHHPLPLRSSSKGIQLSPMTTQTDGLFISIFKRIN